MLQEQGSTTTQGTDAEQPVTPLERPDPSLFGQEPGEVVEEVEEYSGAVAERTNSVRAWLSTNKKSLGIITILVAVAGAAMWLAFRDTGNADAATGTVTNESRSADETSGITSTPPPIRVPSPEQPDVAEPSTAPTGAKVVLDATGCDLSRDLVINKDAQGKPVSFSLMGCVTRTTGN
jgi:hypothetical protein